MTYVKFDFSLTNILEKELSLFKIDSFHSLNLILEIFFFFVLLKYIIFPKYLLWFIQCSLKLSKNLSLSLSPIFFPIIFLVLLYN